MRALSEEGKSDLRLDIRRIFMFLANLEYATVILRHLRVGMA